MLREIEYYCISVSRSIFWDSLHFKKRSYEHVTIDILNKLLPRDRRKIIGDIEISKRIQYSTNELKSYIFRYLKILYCVYIYFLFATFFDKSFINIRYNSTCFHIIYLILFSQRLEFRANSKTNVFYYMIKL